MGWLDQGPQSSGADLERVTALLSDFLFFLLRTGVEIIIAYFVIRSAVGAALREYFGDAKRPNPPAPPLDSSSAEPPFVVVNDEDAPGSAPVVEEELK